MREKLIELFFDYQRKYNSLVVSKDGLADHLIANGVTIQKWIPVSERLPDLELVDVKIYDMDLFPCLVSLNRQSPQKKKVVTKAWYDGDGFIDSNCIRITPLVTHWMPLPEPPKEE